MIVSGATFIYRPTTQPVRPEGGILKLPSEVLYITFLKTDEKDISSIAQTCKLFNQVLQDQMRAMMQKSKSIVDYLISTLQVPEKSVIVGIDEDCLIKKLQAISSEDSPTDAVVVDIQNGENEEDDYKYIIEYLRRLLNGETPEFNKTHSFNGIRNTAYFRIDMLSELFEWDISIEKELERYVLQYGDRSIFCELEKKKLPSHEVIELLKENDKYLSELSKVLLNLN